MVKNKIEHIIRCYKNANDIVLSSGEGLVDDEYTSFMEMIHRKHCKWYSALHSVLGSRHNVQAAYTNETSCNTIQLLHSDDEEDSSDHCSSSNTSSSATRSSAVDPTDSTSNGGAESPRKKTRTKLSYLEASTKRCLKKKSIADNSSNAATKDFASRTKEHFDRMYSMHSEKMKSNLEQQKRQMDLEDRKLNLESEKLKQNNVLVKLKEEKLKGELMNKAFQHNFDMMKKRKEMKDMYPDMSDEELHKLLPLREV